MWVRLNIAVVVMACACNPRGALDATAVETADTADDTTTKPTTTTTTTTTTFTDCSVPSPGSFSSMRLDYPGEEFIFDTEGNFLTAVDWAGTIARMTRMGNWDFIAPYTSDELAGVDLDLEGNLIIADEANGALVSVSMGGAETIIDGSIVSPNSVVVSDLGHIYVTAYDELYKIDGNTGTKTLLDRYSGRDLDGLAFSPDFKYLWFNHDDRGEIHRLELDENGDMVNAEYITEFSLSWNQEIDGMTTDACGNLYIIRTDGRISRYLTDGTKEASYVRVNEAQYASALHFGSGIGGWDIDHLYMMDRFGTLYDIDVGIPGAPEPHLR